MVVGVALERLRISFINVVKKVPSLMVMVLEVNITMMNDGDVQSRVTSPIAFKAVLLDNKQFL
jgi:hypothetical protein